MNEEKRTRSPLTSIEPDPGLHEFPLVTHTMDAENRKQRSLPVLEGGKECREEVVTRNVGRSPETSDTRRVEGRTE